MPRVSIIIPTHNRSELLSNTISSVLNQTLKDFEIIVVDDHSTDNTPNVVKSFNDTRIRYVLNDGINSGPSVCRNLGISNASGEYIAFLDDDDEWLPKKLQTQIDVLDKSDQKVGCIYSKVIVIDKKTGKNISDYSGIIKKKGNLLSQLIIRNPIHTSTLLIRRSCIDCVGKFDEKMRYMEDRDLWIRLAMHYEFEYIDEPLTIAYYHGKEHLSRNLEGQTVGRKILLNRYEEYFKNNREVWSKMYVCLGAQHCQLGNMSKGRKDLIKGIMIYPFNKIAFLHFLGSFFGVKRYNRLRSKHTIE